MCRCQDCGLKYATDIIVPDEIWVKIKPDGKHAGAGLLCAGCIGNRVERLGGYNAFLLTAAT